MVWELIVAGVLILGVVGLELIEQLAARRTERARRDLGQGRDRLGL